MYPRDEIPTTCYYCDGPLDYTLSRPNQLEPGKPLLKWICKACWIKRHEKKRED